MTDNTIVHAASLNHQHLIDLFLFQGRPVNNDPDRQVVVLVNQGYVAGFCPERLQCLWAGYRVAGFDQAVDYDRPHLYYEDTRLENRHRVGPDTFGTQDGIPYHVGHIVPNEVINRQFGRLAQMETFFMSNMSPQRGSLNTGIWLQLENKIRNIEESDEKHHLWAIAGPVFGDNPDTIQRPNGTAVPIPTAYYYIMVDPFRWPWNRPSVVDIVYFLIPQEADRNKPLNDFLVTRQQLEVATNLTFFPNWGSGPAIAATPTGLGSPETRHRLLRQLQ